MNGLLSWLAFWLSVAGLLAVSGVFLVLVGRYRKLREKAEKWRKSEAAVHKAEKIVEEAREKHREIVEEALHKATAIVNEAKVFNQQTQEKMFKTVSLAAAETATQLKDEEERELRGFSEQLKIQVQDQEKLVEQLALAAWEKTRGEIEGYKKTRIEEVDDEVGKLIQEVTARVLTEGLSSRQHQELVIRALEHAKAARIF